MNAWRVLGTVGCMLATWLPAQAQTCELVEKLQNGDTFQISLEMKLQGEMRINRQGSVIPLPLRAEASHLYPERILVVGKENLVDKVARAYENAKAKITVQEASSERTLRSDRRLLVVQRTKEKHLVYSPSGALYRDELDLTSEQFDTLTIPGLLPGKVVQVGETWKLPNRVVQSLCNFEGLTEHSLVGKLEAIQDKFAIFSISGTSSGIDLGALVKMNIEARGKFDLESKRVTDLEWKQKDEREHGPVSPNTIVETVISVKRTPIEQPKTLSDPALVSIPGEETPPAVMTQLDFRDSQGRFELMHRRDWQLVSISKDHVVMRLMDRGDFIAQATITPWASAIAGKPLSPNEFKATMNQTPQWEVEKELQSGEVPTEAKGRTIYRYSTVGKLEGTQVLQNFYLVAAPSGEQVVVVLTMTPKQAEKLGAKDLALVGSMEVPASKPEKNKDN